MPSATAATSAAWRGGSEGLYAADSMAPPAETRRRDGEEEEEFFSAAAAAAAVDPDTSPASVLPPDPLSSSSLLLQTSARPAGQRVCGVCELLAAQRAASAAAARTETGKAPLSSFPCRRASSLPAVASAVAVATSAVAASAVASAVAAATAASDLGVSSRLTPLSSSRSSGLVPLALAKS